MQACEPLKQWYKDLYEQAFATATAGDPRVIGD